jgi:Rps23 Pro-64 3,4-dihydroxylase Tpa1-like proline 4-hydroxylase
MIVLKDFLSEDERLSVVSALSHSAWQFGFISNDKSKPIWNYDKAIAKPAIDILMSKLQEYQLIDYHVNGQTLGQTASVHNDICDGEATHALIYFPSSWEYTWGGRLHIFTEERARIVTPEKNLAILFDSSLFHYAEGPTENVLRLSVGLKLKINRI